MIVSEPGDDAANNRPARETYHASARNAKDYDLPASPEWVDVHEPPPRRRKKRSHRKHTASREQPIEETQTAGRFFPRLSRILESSESAVSSRSSTRGSDTKRLREASISSLARRRHREDSSQVHRRTTKHRTGGIQRRTENLLRINPSLLSVLSSLTGTSDRSSGSNSTVTQHSYDRESVERDDILRKRRYRSEPDARSLASSWTQSNRSSTFDFPMAPSDDGGDDDQTSTSSSASSHYEPSDPGSSDGPGTPSSRSSFPSPTATRTHSVAELRRKYDPHYTEVASAVRSDSKSPQSSVRNLRQQPSISEVPEGEEDEGAMASSGSFEGQEESRHRSSSSSSRSSRHSTGHLRHQEETMRQHMAYATQAQHSYYTDPRHGQHRSCSVSSAQSDQAAYDYHMALQQYQRSSPPTMIANGSPVQAANGYVSYPENTPAPDAPDLSRRTVAGYEMLALELSAQESTVKPLYRKFEYLNHRILLHLQDELCELEEQLRTVDEIIAQMDPAAAEGQRSPASRRGEAYYGTEIHHRRTSLLGRVFLKTEQYNRAMSAYAGMAKDSQAAEQQEVQEYQQWMAKHAPVHEVEARFLHRSEDLVLPGVSKTSVEAATTQSAPAYLPVALMLPLLLYSIIPSLAGRLAVTALIAVGAFIVTATTKIRLLMPMREWAVCGAAYVLLMVAIAGCIPQHGT